MLQTPINVTPSNGQVISPTSLTQSFTFQGDLLTFEQSEYVDMEFYGNPSSGTNQYVAWGNFPEGGHLSVIHNGQRVGSIDNGWWRNFAVAGHNYKKRLRLFQHYPEGMRSGSTNIAGRPMPDMYYARGKVYQKNYGAYNNKSAYERGDVCTNSGYTYACNTIIEKYEDEEYNTDGSSFNASHWTRVYNYQTVIEPDLENIKAPFYYEWDTTSEGTTTHHKILLGAIYMEILYERHMISAYDKTTGIVSFQKVTFNPNTQGYTAQEVTNIQDDSLGSGSKFAITAHNPYKMFVNYLETGWYDFKCRTKPTVTTTVELSVDKSTATNKEKEALAVGIDCEGTYSQSEAVGLKWYQYKMYTLDVDAYSTTTNYRVGNKAVYNGKLYSCTANTSGTFTPSRWSEVNTSAYDDYGGELVDETERIYSYDLQTGFPVHPFTFGHYIELTVATQDDDTQTAYYAVGRAEEDPEHGYDDIEFTPVNINGKTYTANDHSNNVTITDSTVTLTWEVNAIYSFAVFRREIYSDGSIAQYAHYIGNAKQNYIHTGMYGFKFTDYSVGNNRTYQYEIVVKDDRSGSTTYGAPCCAVYVYNVHTKWDGWRIIGLTPKEDKVNRHYMQVGDEWKFISDIDSGDITRNITSALHVGTSAYAKTTRNNTKYESGSFTANLLTVNCPDNQVVDDIERVDAWMKFICDDNPFLLKSDKGDVWVVSIVNSPSRQYDETFDPIFTKVRYEWAESKNKDRCVFY